ncbi:MAG: cytochrome c biogenesis CcdA family protein [Actinomycetes bacterium]
MTARLTLAFTAGIVATVNPCGFALLPAYLTYFLGLEGSSTDDARAPLRRAMSVSAAMTAGFVAVFGVVGTVWSSISELVGQRLPYATLAIGVGVVVLGVAMMRGFEPTVRLPKVELGGASRELTSMFLFGVSYAVASLSCTIGVFISVVSTTLAGETRLTTLATFIAYALGMGVTVTVLTAAVALARRGVVARFRSVLPYVGRVAGAMLIAAGLFVAYYAAVEVQELNSGGSSQVVRWSRNAQSAVQRWTERVGATRLAIAAVIVLVTIGLVTAVQRRTAVDHETTVAD